MQERVWYGGRGLGLLARQVEVLDLLGLRLIAIARGQRVVEVLPARTHAADVERKLVADPLQVCRIRLAEGIVHLQHDVERAELRVTLGEACLERLAPDQVLLQRVEEERLPRLGEFRDQLHVLRSDRSEAQTSDLQTL